MRESDGGKPDDLIPLAQAGLDESEIERQLDRLLHSEDLGRRTWEKKLLEYAVRESLAGNVSRLRPSEITTAVGIKRDRGNSRLRGEAGRLREHLASYYKNQRSDGDIRFLIPTGQYAVYVPADSNSRKALPTKGSTRVLASIHEPVEGSEVNQRVVARGRIDRLDLDMRAWLVVRTPVGDLYPQCRVSRNSPEWEAEVRIGRLQWASDEGAVYEINLVAADVDGDMAFYLYLKANRDGFGPLMPSDCTVLDAKKVTRRDVRTGPQRGSTLSK